MARSTKPSASPPPEGPEAPGGEAGEQPTDASGAAALPDLLKETWAAAHGLASEAEAEASRLLERLASVANLPKSEAERLLTQSRGYFVKSRGLLEKRLETEIRAHLSRLRFPSRQEVAALTSTLDGLEARIATIERRRKDRSPRPKKGSRDS